MGRPPDEYLKRAAYVKPGRDDSRNLHAKVLGQRYETISSKPPGVALAVASASAIGDACSEACSIRYGL
jgi:hypothetical protein